MSTIVAERLFYSITSNLQLVKLQLAVSIVIIRRRKETFNADMYGISILMRAFKQRPLLLDLLHLSLHTSY